MVIMDSHAQTLHQDSPFFLLKGSDTFLKGIGWDGIRDNHNRRYHICIN